METKYTVHYQPKTPSLASKIIGSLVYLIVVSISVYISQGNWFMSLITGCCFLAFLYANLNNIMMKGQNIFKTKEELQAWVDKL